MAKPKIAGPITSLYAELSYGPEFEGRPITEIRKAIVDFRKTFTKQGNEIPKHAHSPEAQNCALAFCLDNERASRLWKADGPSPRWPVDQDKITHCLAQIFALQASNQKRKEPGQSDERSDNIPQPQRSIPAEYGRELSPESRQYVFPMPIGGTRTRPAKTIDQRSDDVNPSGARYMIPVEEIEYLNEVVSLNPRLVSTPIRDLNIGWLANPDAQFPDHADNLIRNYMHSYKVFESEESEDTILKIINPLRKGTDIEELSAGQYNMFKARIQNRINDLAGEMSDKGFLERDPDRNLRRVELLESAWKDRHIHWEKHNPEPPKVLPPKSPALAVQTEPSASGGIQASNNTTPWTLSAKSPGKQTRVLKGKTPLVNPVRRTAADKFDHSDDSPETHHHKRQKSDMALPLSVPNYPDPPSPDDLLSPAPIADDDMEINNQHASMDVNVNFTQDFLSNDTPAPEQDRERENLSQPPLPTRSRQFTPLSSTETTSSSRLDVRTPAPHMLLESALETPKSEPSPFLPTTAPRQRLFYILQQSDLSFDIDTERGIPARQIKSLNVPEFFSLFARRSSVPLDRLDYLTFTVIFAPRCITVVQKGDEVAWAKMKKLANSMFELHRHKPKNEDEMEFNVFVEIGDQKTIAVSQESQEDLYSA